MPDLLYDHGAVVSVSGTLQRGRGDLPLHRQQRGVDEGLGLVNAINFCGNALCVFVLRMGVAGVAVPTLVSRAVGAVIILSLAARRDYVLRITPRTVTRLEGRTVRSILYIGIPSAFESSLFQLGRVLVVSMISLFGTVHISANAVANNLDAVGCIVGNAMGLAMITVVGRCVGAQDFEQTKHYTKSCFCGIISRRAP